MAEERRRRRGRRRGRGRGQASEKPAEGRPEERQPEVTEESEAPGVLPSRLRFRFGRRGGREEEKAPGRRGQGREERATAGAPADVSPLSFWRRGRTRTYREQPIPRQTLGRTLRRIRGLHFPPWVPVAFIIVVVFGILGALFFVRSAAGAPRMGDHWHSTYEIVICGERQADVPQFPGGVHTHGDGIIHIHPETSSEEGAGARLSKWFEYGGYYLDTGGKLTKTELQIPGKRDVWKNGDECPDGTKGVLQVFVNGQKMSDWSRYIPQDGDQIRIEFGPEEEAVAQEGIQIPADEATREITIEASDRGEPEQDSFFSPNTFSIAVGETVKVNVNNTGSVSHSFRIEGVDKEYETDDDFIATASDQASTLIQPGKSGFAVVRIDQPGQYAFRCDIHPDVEVGTLTVEGEASSSPQAETPSAEATAAP